jgi:hypothetical protein
MQVQVCHEVCHGGMKRGWSESGKPGISEAQFVPKKSTHSATSLPRAGEWALSGPGLLQVLPLGTFGT